MNETASTPTPTGNKGRSDDPKGIGMAVAFDWGLAVQLLAMPFLALLPGTSGSFFRFANLSPLSNAFISALISLPFAALLVAFGEAVRRGRNWTRLIQLVANAVGFVGGFFTLITLWQGIQRGSYWPLVTSVILLIFSPLIAWRLSRPETRAWFATISSAEARRRHGGMWVVYIALWALVGGVLQACAALFR